MSAFQADRPGATPGCRTDYNTDGLLTSAATVCARSSKRTVHLINGIALDECRVPERYRTRVPFFNL
jgi:hypothetical protein